MVRINTFIIVFILLISKMQLKKGFLSNNYLPLRFLTYMEKKHVNKDTSILC